MSDWMTKMPSLRPQCHVKPYCCSSLQLQSGCCRRNKIFTHHLGSSFGPIQSLNFRLCFMMVLYSPVFLFNYNFGVVHSQIEAVWDWNTHNIHESGAGVAGMSGDSGRAGRCVPGHRGPDRALHREHHADTAAQPGVQRRAAQHQAPDPVRLWGHVARHRRPL